MANWKKIITSGSNAHLNQITASGNINVAGVATFNDITATGLANQGSEATAVVINGSNVVGTRELGSNAFTSTTIGTTTNALTVDDVTIQLDSGTTFDGSGAKTISIKDGGVDSDALAADISVTSFTSTTITAAQISASTGISSSALLVTGNATINGNIDLEGDIDVNGTANLDNTDIDGTFTMDGTSFDVNATTTLTLDNSNTTNGVKIGTNTSGMPVTIGHTTSEVTIGDNLTVDGDLTVNGTTTTIESTNVTSKDKFLFINSGSTSGDGGIIVSNGMNNSGSAFAFDDSENRWGFTGSMGMTDSAIVPDAYVAAVVTDDNEAVYRKNGNIQVDSSGDIWIYVE
tara:strand:- start:1116 stop:2153 length:1038 start_codon:yes stop_codon:yes gene_type:complete